MNAKIQLCVKRSSSNLCRAFEKVPKELSSHKQLCYHRNPVSCNQPIKDMCPGKSASPVTHFSGCCCCRVSRSQGSTSTSP